MACAAAAAFGETAQPETTQTSSAPTTKAIKSPCGRYWTNPCFMRAKSTSSNMTMNRKSTATAPT